MQRFRSSQNRWWGWLVWCQLICFTSMACDTPYFHAQAPSLPAVHTPPIASPVYQRGMPGILEEAWTIVKYMRHAASQGTLSAIDLAPLQALAQRSLQLHRQTVAYYTDTSLDMKQRGVPHETLQRIKHHKQGHIEAYKRFQGQINKLLLSDIHTPSRWPITDVEDFLRRQQPLSHHTPLDPHNLPYRRAVPLQRPPRLSTSTYAQAFGLPEQPEGTPIAIPTADDLKETKETTRTAAIQALAAKLKSPLEIYRWVRNHIEFHPTYGSIQGADYCRQTKLCNAFDTASLLIALLRAQKIPARYVFGTIDIPIARARNWVSRFHPQKGRVSLALASGGIPTASLVQKGIVHTIRMEHVWVEAWIDYIPSRGSVHRKGDTWIPMDGAFKANVYQQPLDIAKRSKFDAKGNYDQFRKPIKTDTLGGLLKGPDTKAVQQAFAQAQSNLDRTTKPADESYAKLVGTKTPTPFQENFLPASLPYTVKTLGQRLNEIPDRLRHKVHIAITTKLPPPSPLGLPRRGGQRDFSVSLSLPEVVGKQLSIAYNPATPTDNTTLLKYWPKASEQTKAGQWPKTLPSVIRLKPTLLLDGKVLATGNTTNFGNDNQLQLKFTAPDIDKNISNLIVAGSYQAIVINPVKIAQEHMQKLKAKAEVLAKQLDRQDKSGLSRESMYGNHLHSTGLSYWSQQDINNAIQAHRSDVIDIRLPSCGLFAFDLSVTYGGFGRYQSPLSVAGRRVTTDIDHDLHVVVSHTGDQKAEARYFSVAGITASAYEASSWELSVRPKTASPDHGISSIHMLQYAAQNGVPIYSIRQSKLNAILPKLSLPKAVLTDIKNGAAAGKVIITPAREMVKDGWKGVGYIVLDEATGAAAYQISGGKSGGESPLPSIPTWLSVTLGVVLTTAGVFAPPLAGVALAVVGLALVAYDLAATFSQIDQNKSLSESQRQMLKAAALVSAMIGVITNLAGILLGATGPFVAISIYTIYIGLLTAQIINGLTTIAVKRNQNNQYLKNT